MAGDLKSRLASDEDSPWHITSDTFSYDDINGMYILKGNINIKREGLDLVADFVKFDQKNMKVSASGDVVLRSEEDILTGSAMDLDLNAETGVVYDGALFFEENNFYINGDKILKTGENVYEAEKVSVTTCEGSKPAWKLTGRQLKVTIEGYGFVKHATLWAKNIPVLYTPFFAFPAKTKRQTGLLAPYASYSDRKGIGYEQPVYWAINQSSDATFYMHHMQKRGEKAGVEYRYVLGDLSKGALMVDYLDDRQVDDGLPQSSDDWGYIEDEDNPQNNIIRSDSERYWFRMKLDQEIPLGFFAKLDLDIVSDQDYLREFRGGYSGFDKTDEYFTKSFGREFDKYDEKIRKNKLNLNKSWTQYNLNAMAQWKDNIVEWEDTENGNPQVGEENITVQYLPQIEFDGLRQELRKTPLDFKLDTQYAFLYREDGTTDDPFRQCHRTDIYPRFYLPVRVKNYVSIEPSVGLRETLWYIEEVENAGDESFETDHSYNRQFYDTKLDLSTQLFKDFYLRRGGEDRIRHVLVPQVIHEYIPDQDQEEFPNFDSLDRIGKKNLITCAITNTFTSRLKKYTAVTSGSVRQEGEERQADYTKREFCRFKIEQSYDINEDKEQNTDNWRNGITREPFYPLYMELAVNPADYLSVWADAKWTFYENEFLTRNIEAALFDKRGDSIALEHRYTRDSLESIHKSENVSWEDDYQSKENIMLDLNFVLSDAFSMSAEYERDLLNDQDVMKGIGLLYASGCWSFNLYCKDEDDERKIEFIISLHGLGELGTDAGIK